MSEVNLAKPAMSNRIILAIAIELAYAILTRTWLRAHAEGVGLELLLSGCRAVTIAAYWLLFKEIIQQRPRPHVAAQFTPLYFAGMLPLLLVPFLFDGGMPTDMTVRIIFGFTSIIVAVREELLYRGVVQTLLEDHFGRISALLLSSAIFTVYHYGAQPLTIVGAVGIFSLSYVLGLVYIRTGSLLVPIAMHAGYDAAWSFGPLVSNPLDDWWRLPFQLSGLALVAIWAKKRKTCSDSGP
ncbi:MAG: CPBP family intramembrane glutamic endopeptidase [Pseudomonadota bacterium]